MKNRFTQKLYYRASLKGYRASLKGVQIFNFYILKIWSKYLTKRSTADEYQFSGTSDCNSTLSTKSWLNFFQFAIRASLVSIHIAGFSSTKDAEEDWDGSSIWISIVLIWSSSNGRLMARGGFKMWSAWSYSNLDSIIKGLIKLEILLTSCCIPTFVSPETRAILRICPVIDLNSR